MMASFRDATVERDCHATGVLGARSISVPPHVRTHTFPEERMFLDRERTCGTVYSRWRQPTDRDRLFADNCCLEVYYQAKITACLKFSTTTSCFTLAALT